MKPLSKNKLVEEFATTNNLNLDLVNVVISMYWKEVRLTMNTLVHPRIRIPFFGTVITLPKSVNKAIAKNKNMMMNIPPTSYSNMEKYKIIEDKVKRLELLKQKLEQEKQDHERFKAEKKDKH